MSAINKNKKTVKQAGANKLPATKRSTGAGEKVGNYEKHPFFVKKANDMKELLEKVGLPKSFVTKGR